MAEPRPLLALPDGWTRLNTRPVDFATIMLPDDAVGLELLRSLTNLRTESCVKPSGTAGTDLPVDQALLDKMAEYVNSLEALVVKWELDRPKPTPLTTHWNSPFSGKISHFYRLTGLACDMGMAAFLYGSALRSQALQTLAAAWGSTAGAGEDSGGAAGASTSNQVAPAPATVAAPGASTDMGSAAAEASTHLRRAAGVFTWLHEKGLPRVKEQLAADRPAELVMSMARVMAQSCLAEAQAVAAVRAGQRGTTASLVAALHAGAWETWEGAAKTLKDSTGDYNLVSDRLRRHLAASSAVARARALRWLAVDLRDNKQQAGQAEAACLAAASLLTSARLAADVDATWRGVVAAESAVLEATRQECARMREMVTYQTIAKTSPDTPQGKVIVGAIPFVPAPEAASGGGSGRLTPPAGAADSVLPSEQGAATLAAQGFTLANALGTSLSMRKK